MTVIFSGYIGSPAGAHKKERRAPSAHVFTPHQWRQAENDAVLRSGAGTREFSIARRDVEEALSGGTGEVRLLSTAEKVGTARLSSSGRALNRVIDGKLHTVPLKLLVLVLEGKRRKVALFVGVS